MTLKLKKSPSNSPSPDPLSWDAISNQYTPPSPIGDPASLPSPPTTWLSARDMKLFGAQPLSSDAGGIVRCRACSKPVLISFIIEHNDNCRIILSGGAKKPIQSLKDSEGSSKKRKASPSPSDPVQPSKKKLKADTAAANGKVTKGRLKGPINYDKQCGVINDKGLPCSRSLTCKSHSMGAKRAVQGRSRLYNDLLVEWQRENNPNWVEPVKRETKAEKKEKKEKEKAEKKRLAMEAALAAGIDLNAKRTTGVSGKKSGGGKKAAAGAGGGSATKEARGEDDENLDEIDSEAEVDKLVQAVNTSFDRGLVGIPLAIPCDAGSWFVARRERKRCCRDLLAGALGVGMGVGSNATTTKPVGRLG